MEGPADCRSREIHNFKPPSYPTSEFKFRPRAKNGKPVKEVTEDGRFLYGPASPSTTRTLFKRGPRNAYYTLVKKLSKEPELPSHTVLSLPDNYDAVTEKIDISYQIRLEIESGAVALNGVFQFQHVAAHAHSLAIESDAIRSLNWRVCPHVTMKYRVIDDTFEPTTPTRSGEPPKSYRRHCMHCKTYFVIYGSKSWEVQPRYTENVAIRRELGNGRRPEDKFWTGYRLDKDMYDDNSFEASLKNRRNR